MFIRAPKRDGRTNNCLEDTRFFVPIFSVYFHSISKEILLHGGIIVGKSYKADICIAPEDYSVQEEGWYIPKLINDSIRYGGVPCLCRYDKLTGQPINHRDEFFGGLSFYYPSVSHDYQNYSELIEFYGGSMEECPSDYTILLAPRGSLVFDSSQWISIDYIDHCIKINERDCFCGFEI
jgi:hypothetical protein